MERTQKRRKENGTTGSGMEDSKERREDKGEQTHAKLTPAVSGDLGSGDRPPPPPPRERGELQIVAGPAGGAAGASSRFSW